MCKCAKCAKGKSLAPLVWGRLASGWAELVPDPACLLVPFQPTLYLSPIPLPQASSIDCKLNLSHILHPALQYFLPHDVFINSGNILSTASQPLQLLPLSQVEVNPWQEFTLEKVLTCSRTWLWLSRAELRSRFLLVCRSSFCRQASLPGLGKGTCATPEHLVFSSWCYFRM